MCGFLGVITNNNIQKSHIKSGNEFLSCRGPDDHRQIEGQLSEKFNYLFSFHRLSIIDLSENASQPMTTKNGNSIIMFNGEIYNFRELRKEMEEAGIRFSTSHSDTEVLLLGIENYGTEFIDKVEGQFSVAFLNEKEEKLTLIRDRLGQKPLYYSLNENELIFSSSFKSVLTYKNNFEINSDQISVFFELGIIPSPNTLDQNIFKLEPGEIIEFSITKLNIEKKYKYWKIDDYVSENPFDEEIFLELFNKAVQKRLVSDVPIATLLSGGIDSTSIVKSLYGTSLNKVNTYSVSNKNPAYDESIWSKKVSEKYSTNHTVEEIDGQNLLDDPLEVIRLFDEPYSDPSIFPSNLIYNRISQDYKVALSGDGGDELLGGYEKVSLSISKSYWPDFLLRFLVKIIPSEFGTGAGILKKSSNHFDSFTALTTDKKLIRLLSLTSGISFRKKYLDSRLGVLKSLIIADYRLYLSEMMLHKVDRTSMANSLEVRSPFLDHKLIEYVLGSDMSFFNLEKSKLILKNYLHPDFSDDFILRKKMGFVFDLESWIFTNEDLILNIINSHNFLNTKRIKKLFKRKSRINAIRILKILTMCLFVDDYYKISNEITR